MADMDSATPLHKISGISLQVFRYNFDEGFMDELTAFAKVHEHDSRLDFKDAWKTWMTENKELVDAETDRLVQLGFAGDVADKMFKSVRYYFRKKSLVPSVQPVRKTYDTLHKPVLVAMDDQIRTQIKINVIETKPDADGNVPSAVSTISPAEGFANFCDEHQLIILDAIRSLHAACACDADIYDGHGDNILPPVASQFNRENMVGYMNKLKKTYKNRFYNIKVALSKIATQLNV
jgi:hypothetical protein